MEAIVAGRPAEGRTNSSTRSPTATGRTASVFLPRTTTGRWSIDAKFPLEAVSALRDARTGRQKKAAAQRFVRT